MRRQSHSLTPSFAPSRTSRSFLFTITRRPHDDMYVCTDRLRGRPRDTQQPRPPYTTLGLYLYASFCTGHVTAMRMEGGDCLGRLAPPSLCSTSIEGVSPEEAAANHHKGAGCGRVTQCDNSSGSVSLMRALSGIAGEQLGLGVCSLFHFFQEICFRIHICNDP